MSKTHLALICLAAALLSSCSSPTGHKSNEKYFLVSTNIKLQYWQAANLGLIRAAKVLDVMAETVGPDTYDPQAEQQAFRSAVAKKPAGILVSAADAKLLKGDIDSAISQGIPVLTVDSDSPDSKRLTFIGTNNRQAGAMGAKRLIKEMGGKGNVVIYTIPGQSNLEERLRGYKDAIAETGIKIAEIVDMKGDPRVAFDSTNDMIDKGKVKPDAFVCLEAIACKEVADVLERKKITGKVIIAMDTDQGTLDWIKKGSIAATIAQKPYTMAYYGLKILGDLYLNKLPALDKNFGEDTQSPLPMFLDTGATMIDKGNVDGFITARDASK